MRGRAHASDAHSLWGQRATSSSPRTGGNGHLHPCTHTNLSWLTNEQTAVFHHLRVCLGVARDKKGERCWQTAISLFLAQHAPLAEIPRFVALLQRACCLHFFTLYSHIQKREPHASEVCFVFLKTGQHRKEPFILFQKSGKLPLII